VKFVLCTTEPDKLPITILSRCQRFDFQTVDTPAIARRLAQIVEAEGAVVSPEALSLIARRAAGSMRDSQSLLEQLLGSAAGPIGVDEVHAVIGTGREEKVGAIIACLAARDARGAIAAFDAATAGGADPGGVLEQVVAALRDSLLASVGCGPEVMLQGDGLGVDLAALGRQTGTVTLLAMLQIVDQALSRMRSSGHAAVLAEMAIIRLASLEDLDSLAEAIDTVGAAGGGQSSVAPAPRVVSAPATPRPVEPTREKKTTELTGAAPTAPDVAAHEPARAAEPGPTRVDDPVAGADPAPADENRGPSTPPPAEAAPELPADPLAAWRRGAEVVGGLAVDFAELAQRAVWRGDLLEVVLPVSAGNAASFLRRPEIASGLTRALSDLVGRPVRHGLVIESPADAATAAPDTNGRGTGPAAPAERARPAVSQAALLREAADHPLVMHVRSLFDAAVRKVEPPRNRPTATVAAGPSADTVNTAAVADEDERDHSATHEAEGGDGSGGIDG
jgi:DNA polymerase-3 subunit gamma/tau